MLNLEKMSLIFLFCFLITTKICLISYVECGVAIASNPTGFSHGIKEHSAISAKPSGQPNEMEQFWQWIRGQNPIFANDAVQQLLADIEEGEHLENIQSKNKENMRQITADLQNLNLTTKNNGVVAEQKLTNLLQNLREDSTMLKWAMLGGETSMEMVLHRQLSGIKQRISLTVDLMAKQLGFGEIIPATIELNFLEILPNLAIKWEKIKNSEKEEENAGGKEENGKRFVEDLLQYIKDLLDNNQFDLGADSILSGKKGKKLRRRRKRMFDDMPKISKQVFGICIIGMILCILGLILLCCCGKNKGHAHGKDVECGGGACGTAKNTQARAGNGTRNVQGGGRKTRPPPPNESSSDEEEEDTEAETAGRRPRGNRQPAA